MSEEPLTTYDDPFANHNLPVSEVSRAHMEGLVAGAHELHQTYPEFVGMTVFGSTARGEARPAGARGADDMGSDADIYAYFRPDDDSYVQGQAYPNIPPEVRVIVNQDPSSGPSNGLRGMVGFAWDINAEYQRAVQQVVERHGLPPNGDVHAMPISEEIVTHQVNTILEQAAVYEDTGSVPKGARFSRNLRGLFHVPVDDHGLEPFRAQALSQLAQSPQGETAWKFIRYSVGYDEVGKDGDPNQIDHRPLPQTLAEAVEYYGVPPSDSTQGV